MNVNEYETEELIRQGESLRLEFKGDLKCLSDRELVAAVVSLANTEGGDLLLGVEDDGSVTGLHANHLNISGMPSLIANKTNPSISVGVERCDIGGKSVARISVQKSLHLVSTSEGVLLRRRLKIDGTPEAVPFYPHEFIRRQSSLGFLDPSAMILEEIDADPDFLKMVVEQEEKLGLMPVDSLIVLSRLRDERRLTTADLAPSVQKPEANVRTTLERLVESGFLEPHGTGRGRTYTLSARIYQKAGQRAEYIRQAGFDQIQQEQMVLNYIEKHGGIKRMDVMELCYLNGSQAYRLLRKLVRDGKIERRGERKQATYTRLC